MRRLNGQNKAQVKSTHAATVPGVYTCEDRRSAVHQHAHLRVVEYDHVADEVVLAVELDRDRAGIGGIGA